MKDYPLFIPPEEVAEKTHQEWTSKEAKVYFDWLTSVIDERLTNLALYLDEEMSDNHEEVLIKFGHKAVSALKTAGFSTVTDAGPKLTNKGYALAADMGLLTAKFLIDDCYPKVQWMILKKPKSDVSYQLPVLTGFGVLTVEPVGGSIANSYGILRGSKEADNWLKGYTFWKAKAR